MSNLLIHTTPMLCDAMDDFCDAARLGKKMGRASVCSFSYQLGQFGACVLILISRGPADGVRTPVENLYTACRIALELLDSATTSAARWASSCPIVRSATLSKVSLVTALRFRAKVSLCAR